MNHATKRKNRLPFLFPIVLSCLLYACSFDYGSGQGAENERPDIVMENIEYVRVRGGDLLARFQAEHAERWEESQIMRLKNFAFEQMEDGGQTVNVEGTAGGAEVELESGDLILFDGVSVKIESEDIIINIDRLEWKDQEKTLKGNESDRVHIERSDGTSFSGIGFSADVRGRTWTFTGEVEGTFVEKGEEKATEEVIEEEIEEEDNEEEDNGDEENDSEENDNEETERVEEDEEE